MAIKYISFDLDGTLIDKKFDRVFWDEEVPQLYAEAHGVLFEEAQKICFQKYEEYDKTKASWYRPSVWFPRLGIPVDWDHIIADMRKHVDVYPDVVPVLKELSQKYTLIVVTNATTEFLDIKLSSEGIKEYFSQIISVPDAFEKPKREADAYELVLEKLGCDASEILHVGDNYEEDYEHPTRHGIKSLFVDRKNEREGEHVIKSLTEIKEKLETL